MRMMEAMFNQYHQQRFDAQVWAGLDEALKDICRYPGLKTWWSIRDHWFSEEFKIHVSQQLSREDLPRLYDET